jgi:hypothetical protein
MPLLRTLLITILVVLVGYTGLVIANHGWNLLPVFFGDIAVMGWPGQFNLDFSFMLVFSALWVAWRNRFTPAGLGLAVLAAFFGSLFLSIYLLVLTTRTKGDMRAVMIGDR